MHGTANVPATESGMSTAETGMSATTVATSAMLRPDWYSQEEQERRDGDPATHKAIIGPFFKNGGTFTICDEDAEPAGWRPKSAFALNFFRSQFFGRLGSRF